MAKVYILLFLLFNLKTTLTKELPNDLNVCKRNDPYLSNCIQHSINNLRQHTINGDVFYGIPKLDPIFLENVLNEEPVGPKRKYNMTVKNLNIFGLAEYNVTSVLKGANENGEFIGIRLYVDMLRLDGEYGINGSYGLLKVSGSGKLTGYLRNVEMEIQLSYRINQRKKENYVHVSKVNINITNHGGNLVLDNVFSYSKILSKRFQTKINNNFISFSMDLILGLRRELSKYFQDITNTFFLQYSYEQLFPLK